MLKKTSARKLFTLGLLAVCIVSCLLLSACDTSCKHTWAEANCDTAKTCTLCGVVEGEPLGHDWAEATCVKVKTCTRCQKPGGSDLKPHNYSEATTDAPKTCSGCGKTKGTPIITDSRFKTESCKALFGSWTGRIYMTGDDIDLPDFKGKMVVNYTLTFNNDGTYSESMTLADKKGFVNDLEEYYTELLYAQFAAEGMSKAQANNAMIATYGKNVAEYAKILAVSVDYDALWAEYAPKGVYYVAKGKLFTDAKWSGNMQKDVLTVTETTLEIESLSEEFPGLVFYKDLI